MFYAQVYVLGKDFDFHFTVGLHPVYLNTCFLENI